MKKISFVLIICVFTLALASSSFAAPDIYARNRGVCSRFNSVPKVSVKMSYGKLSYDYTKNTKYLSSQKIASDTYYNGIVEGLTAVQIYHSINPHVKYERVGKNGYCAVVEKVEFEIGYRNPKIYISKDLKAGSCRKKLVERHEQTHAQIYVKTLEHYVPIFKKRLKEIVKEMKPIYAGKTSLDLQNAFDYIHSQYELETTSLVDEYSRAVNAEQSKLDNTSNYSMEGDLCLPHDRR